MERFITFGSIQQFRNIIKSVTHQSRYSGVDVNGLPVYNSDKLPTITSTASEKIHGTNGAVCYTNPSCDGGTFWVQSRKNIITPIKDNAGCAFHHDLLSHKWIALIHELAYYHNIDLKTHIISVFFEWAGGSIQKNSALTGSEKKSIIFQHFKVSPVLAQDTADGNVEVAEWYETRTEQGWIELADHNIHNIMNFTTWSIDIDFDNPAIAQNKFIKLVEETIEPASPLGKVFNHDENIGEGVVVTLEYKGSLHKFKVKGEKHSKSKVKTLKPVDEEKENAKIAFANYATPAWRLEQMWDDTFDYPITGLKADIRHTGEFLRAVIKDIMKEESDVMVESGLEPKDVNGQISQIARQWFMEELNKDVGL